MHNALKKENHSAKHEKLKPLEIHIEVTTLFLLCADYIQATSSFMLL